MSNPYYTHSTYPTPNAAGSSAQLRAELELITAGFSLLPNLSGNAYQVAMVNSAGTALVPSSALQALAITASTIDSTAIGASVPSTGKFAGLIVSSGAAALGASVSMSGGTIDGTLIGNTAPSVGKFTSLSASSGYAGSVTGDVTSSGTSTFNNASVSGTLTATLSGNVSASSGTSSFAAVSINGQLDMNAGTVGTITGLSTPTNASDAATKSYVDSADALKLNLTGGTMSGAIAMGASKVTGLGDPSSAQDAATKTYVDTADALKLNLGGGTMSGAIAMGTNRITGLADPSSAQDAATKSYVDTTAQGLDAKASVRVASTANLSLLGTQTIDGVAVVAADRVLVKDQTVAANNGIYVVSAGAWSRSSDMSTWASIPSAFVFVEMGTVNADNGFVCTSDPGGTLGSSAINWTQFSGAGQIIAGAGMTKTGNTLDVGTASSTRIVVNADNIDLATTTVSAGTYQSMTVDAYGRVTSGTNPSTLSGYNISDAYSKTQVDASLALKLNVAGGAMSGPIAMGTSRITGVGDPSLAQDAATKNYVDTGAALKLNLSGGTMSGSIAMGSSKITGVGDPTLAQDAATKNYVDAILGSATSASASATAAAGSATNAASSAFAAASSATASATSATNAATSFTTFNNQYLGSKTSDPTLNNSGAALVVGNLYWNSASSVMKAYDGANWLTAYLPATGYLQLAGGTMTGPINFASSQTISAVVGGTGQTSYTTGDLLYASAANALSKLGVGSNGQVLTLVSGVPAWQTSTGGVTSFSAGSTGLTPSTTSTGAVTLSGTLAVSNGGTGVTSSTGSGSNVLSTSPTLITPVLGTPSSVTLTNATGLPISTGVSGLGTGVASALTVNTGSSGAVVLLNGALGTPSSATLSNATGLPISTGLTGLGTGVATSLAISNGTAGAYVVNGGVLGTPSSGNLANCTFPTLNQSTTGNAATASTSTNITGGTAGKVLYQSGASTTAFIDVGTTGQVLTSAGTGTPTWTTPSAGGGQAFLAFGTTGGF